MTRWLLIGLLAVAGALVMAGRVERDVSLNSVGETSFAALGAILMGVSWVYARVRRYL